MLTAVCVCFSAQDLILRRPFLPEPLGVRRGYARSSQFSYMKGCCNELALRHIPEVAPRNDTLAGPFGRRSDMVRCQASHQP